MIRRSIETALYVLAGAVIVPLTLMISVSPSAIEAPWVLLTWMACVGGLAGYGIAKI